MAVNASPRPGNNVLYNKENYDQSNSRGRGGGNNNKGGGRGSRGNTQYSHPQANT